MRTEIKSCWEVVFQNWWWWCWIIGDGDGKEGYQKPLQDRRGGCIGFNPCQNTQRLITGWKYEHWWTKNIHNIDSKTFSSKFEHNFFLQWMLLCCRLLVNNRLMIIEHQRMKQRKHMKVRTKQSGRWLMLNCWNVRQHGNADLVNMLGSKSGFRYQLMTDAW